MAVQKVYFATGNKNKLHEMANILGPTFDVIGLNVDLPELQGDTDDIVKGKCKIAFEKYSSLGLKDPIVVEDTSLCFNALNGLPGPYIKWFMNKLGNEKLYELIDRYDDKGAQAVCTYCFIEETNDGDCEPKIIKGVVKGKIISPAQADREHNFGWDPIFVPDGYNQTFAEMDPKEKNKISHRSVATNKLREYLTNRRI
jgi:inosine triphosphate pyrophosphatase